MVKGHILGPSIARNISWLFLSGFGVNPDSLDHQLLGTPREMLARNQRMRSLCFMEDFPADSSRYYEAKFDIASPPRLFEHTSNHSLVSFEIESHRYPIALIYDLYDPVGGYLARGREMLDLMRRKHSTPFHAQIIRAMVNFGHISGRELYKSQSYISYAVYGRSNGSANDFRTLPLFPGVYPPGNDYVRVLLHCALQRIENRCRTQDDVCVLVLGSGSGVEGVEIADALGISVDCVDINPLAVANTRASSIYSGMDGKMRVWESDGLDSVTDKYDFILFNAPLPVERKIGNINPNLFDSQGKTLRKVFEKLPRNLREGGKLLLMNEADINAYLPSTLRSDTIFRFKAAGVALGIHEIAPS
jgi:SAM-dependent methyltransferase